MKSIVILIALLCFANNVFAESDAVLCAQNDKDACDYVAIAYDEENNHAMAMVNFRKACKLNSDYGCFWLGLYLDPEFIEYKVDKDLQASNLAYKKACEMEYASACNNLGTYLRDGRNGQAVDMPLAMEYFKKACLEIEDAEGEACLSLGYEYDVGKNVKSDKALAHSIYLRGCDEIDHAGSCYGLANTFYNGEGVRQSNKNAKFYYAKACNGGDEDGCEMLEYLFD